MALANELPDAIITESGLKITPLDAAVPDTAQADRPDGDDPTARQDHRIAAGGRRMDGLHRHFAT
jgi:hypothetical protein